MDRSVVNEENEEDVDKGSDESVSLEIQDGLIGTKADFTKEKE